MTLLDDVRRIREDVKTVKDLAVKHEEQINGKRGLQAAMEELSEELRGLRRALWTVGGGIVLASIGFGFSVLMLIGGP
jgi:hypothetical protein